jgi:ergothioneine biosynthesis protein EgtB
MSASDVFPVPMAANSAALPLLEGYAAVRKTTEVICSDLSPEDHMIQSMPDASPAKWHLAHTSWFFETFILKPSLPGYRLFHGDFTFLFNSYYKQLGSHPNRSYRGLFSRPSLDEVRDYRRYVDRHMLKLLGDNSSPEIAALVELGLNHEQQHQELIVTDVKHGFWSNPLRPAWKDEARSASLEDDGGRSPSSDMQWRTFDEGLYSIGYDGTGFCFDNETPSHHVFLNAYSIASRPVTNGEYLEFIRDAGYSRPELWLSDGWDTINTQGWGAPLFWERQGDHWLAYTSTGIRPVDANEPVCHVSYYEADAYARWAGARLATEAEWEVAGSQQPIEGNFLESGRFHPNKAEDEFFGNVWEWTSSAYAPYAGFRPAAGALGEYNGKFMSNQMVLRGGSCATPQSHIRATYRNFFPPHARWQFMGIRLAK